MADPKISGTLQENLLTLLAHDAEHGRVVARLIESSYYEGEYQTVAERFIAYWRKYDRPPGPHAADLFSDVLEDPHNRRAGTYKRTLQNMQALWEAGVNSKYVLGEASSFRRRIQLQAAILESADKITSQQEQGIVDVEELWNKILRVREIVFDPGMTLDQYDKVLENLVRRQLEFTTGIEQLDKAGVVPYRGALMVLVAKSGGGKSWWLISIGKQALLQRKKVAHVSLEMSEEVNLQRYYQALFSITKRDTEVELSRLKVKDKQLIDVTRETVKPELSFQSSMISEELETRLEQWSKRAANIRIKRFPPRALTPDGLRGYLDNLEVATRFIPDLLILDYASLMKTDPRNHRIELGRNIEELRAVAVERNIAVVSAHQSNRAGAMSKTVRSTDVGEDWSVVQTCDTILTFSATEQEKQRGLGRLYVAKARDEADAWGLVIAQGVPMGQFCLDSAYLNQDYFDVAKLNEKAEVDEDQDIDEDD